MSKKRLLGYQIADTFGTNIQGDDADPTTLWSHEVMSPSLANAVMREVGEGFLLQPIFEGDIDDVDVIRRGLPLKQNIS